LKKKKQERNEAQQKRRELEEEKLKRREEAASNHVCRGDHTNSKAPIWGGSKKWVWCDFCESFGFCKKCVKDNREYLARHEEECQHIMEPLSDEQE